MQTIRSAELAHDYKRGGRGGGVSAESGSLSIVTECAAASRFGNDRQLSRNSLYFRETRNHFHDEK